MLAPRAHHHSLATRPWGPVRPLRAGCRDPGVVTAGRPLCRDSRPVGCPLRRTGSQGLSVSSDVVVPVGQATSTHEVDGSTKERLEISPKSDMVEQRSTRVEVDEEIDIARRIGGASSHGTEDAHVGSPVRRGDPENLLLVGSQGIERRNRKAFVATSHGDDRRRRR